MEKIKSILIYPIVILFDIFEFIINFIENIIYIFKRNKYNYEDIVAVEYNAFLPPDFDNYIVYNKENYTAQKTNYDKIIKKTSQQFKTVISKLEQNKVLKYKNIYSFCITPIQELFYEDGGKGEETFTIYFKNNRRHIIRISRYSKVFENIIQYLFE